MKRFFTFLFLFSLTFHPLNLHAIVKIEETVSKKGIKAWFVEDKNTDVIAINGSFRAGSAYDPPGKEGIVAILTRLIDEGAGDYDDQILHEKMQDLGISIGFSATQDRLLFSLKTTREHKDEAFKMLKWMLTRPRWTEEIFRSQQQRHLVTVANKEKSAGFIAQQTFLEVMFKGHPYARRVDGSLKSVASIKSDDIKAFQKKALTRDGLLVGVCGHLSGEEAAEMLDDVFGDLPFKSPFPPLSKPELPQKGIIKHVEAPYPQSTAIFGQKGIPHSDDRFIMLALINHIFGESSVSRLMTEVREKRGLVYSISVGLDFFTMQPLFSGSLGSENASVMNAIELVKAEWEKLQKHGLTQEELEEAKSHVLGAYTMNFVSSPNIASLAHLYQLYEMPRNYIQIREEKIKAVTLPMINDFAKSFFTPETLVFVVVGKETPHVK